MVSVLRAGGTVIGFAKFDPAAVLAAIGQYGVTHGFFVPTMFVRMLKLAPEVREAVPCLTDIIQYIRMQAQKPQKIECENAQL